MASIFEKIESAEHTFAAWAEKELTKLIGESPTIIGVTDTTLTYVGPILQTVLQGAGQTAAAAEVGSIIKEALSDLTALRGVIEDAGATPSAASLLLSIQTNLSGLLTVDHISNPISVALVTKVLQELAALLAAFPTVTPAAVAA